jgi:hypothetical protein
MVVTQHDPFVENKQAKHDEEIKKDAQEAIDLIKHDAFHVAFSRPFSVRARRPVRSQGFCTHFMVPPAWVDLPD